MSGKHPARVITALSTVVGGLALAAAGTGLLWRGGGPRTFTTVRGQTVQLDGHGLYRYDSLFTGAGQRGTDAVVLLVGLPLLVASLTLYRRGSLRGQLLLTGTLVFFAYVYGSAALGTVAYNSLFLVYVALFSAALFAFLLAFTSVDRRLLATRLSPRTPRRGPAVFMFASGAVTFVAWVLPVLTSLATGPPPDRMDSASTLVTTALDVGIIVPCTMVAGVLILRRDPLGYLVALALLVLEAMLAPMIAAQTVSQVAAGVVFPPGQLVGPVAGFVVVALLAVWFLVAILRAIRGVDTDRTGRWSGTRVTDGPVGHVGTVGSWQPTDNRRTKE